MLSARPPNSGELYCGVCLQTFIRVRKRGAGSHLEDALQLFSASSVASSQHRSMVSSSWVRSSLKFVYDLMGGGFKIYRSPLGLASKWAHTPRDIRSAIEAAPNGLRASRRRISGSCISESMPRNSRPGNGRPNQMFSWSLDSSSGATKLGICDASGCVGRSHVLKRKKILPLAPSQVRYVVCS